MRSKITFCEDGDYMNYLLYKRFNNEDGKMDTVEHFYKMFWCYLRNRKYFRDSVKAKNSILVSFHLASCSRSKKGLREACEKLRREYYA